MFGDNIGFLEIDHLNSIDIDTELDFAFAEFLISKDMIQ